MQIVYKETIESDEHCRYASEFKQLSLAIKWNRLDLAEDYLFKGKRFATGQLNELLSIALQHKQVCQNFTIVV